MRAIIVLVAIVALAGCAASRSAPPPPAIDPAAVCTSAEQCDAMWAEAMVQAQNLSGMRLQTATDSFLQTYGETNFDRMSAMARRVPHPDGTTTIEAAFSCRYCGNLAYDAVNLFTAAVKRAGAGFAPGIPTAAPGNAAKAPVPLTEQAYKEQQVKQLLQQGLPYDEYQRRYQEIMAR